MTPIRLRTASFGREEPCWQGHCLRRVRQMITEFNPVTPPTSAHTIIAIKGGLVGSLESHAQANIATNKLQKIAIEAVHNNHSA